MTQASSPYRVVVLEPSQWTVLADLRAAFAAETHTGWPENPLQLVALQADTAAMFTGAGSVALVLLHEENPVGFIAAVVDGLPWLSERVLKIVGHWVHPDHRKGTAGFLLIRAGIRLVKALPVPVTVHADYAVKNTYVHGGDFLRKWCETAQTEKVLVRYVFKR